MTEAMERDRLAGAKAQGQAQFDSIVEMVEELTAAREHENHECSDATGRALEDAEQRIHEDALSVEVRSGWHSPASDPRDDDASRPTEYRILLCTGGPAVQIVGELSEHGEPETARLQVQDWFVPWTDMRPAAASDYESAARSVGWRVEVDGWRWGETEGPFASAKDVCARYRLAVPVDYDSEPILLEYARCFYFGE